MFIEQYADLDASCDPQRIRHASGDSQRICPVQSVSPYHPWRYRDPQRIRPVESVSSYHPWRYCRTVQFRPPRSDWTFIRFVVALEHVCFHLACVVWEFPLQGACAAMYFFPPCVSCEMCTCSELVQPRHACATFIPVGIAP